MEMKRDQAWLEQATYPELMAAIREEPSDSELFQGRLGDLFWKTYRDRIEQLWGHKTGKGDSSS